MIVSLLWLLIILTSYDCSCIQLADGLVLEKKSCPLGVLLIVFESRPDALVQVGKENFLLISRFAKKEDYKQ